MAALLDLAALCERALVGLGRRLLDHEREAARPESPGRDDVGLGGEQQRLSFAAVLGTGFLLSVSLVLSAAISYWLTAGVTLVMTLFLVAVASWLVARARQPLLGLDDSS